MGNFSNFTKIRFTAATGWTTLAGAVGGYLGYALGGALLTRNFEFLTSPTTGFDLVLGQALISMCIGVGISVFVLAVDNQQSLRGRWYRDLWNGLGFFAVVAFAGGLCGQLLYGVIQSSRALPWLLDGAGIGTCIGILRGDSTQTRRGALGGAIGGLIGGLGVDLVLNSYQSAATFALACGVMGAMIGLLLRLVQDSMSEAWLVGVTEGPYQNKSYPLNPPQVTVGRSELNDVSLYKSSELPMQSGAFVFSNGQWLWQGEPVAINGTPQTQVALNPGDDIRLGGSGFRFETRVASGATSQSGLSSLGTTAAGPGAAPSWNTAPVARSPVPSQPPLATGTPPTPPAAVPRPMVAPAAPAVPAPPLPVTPGSPPPLPVTPGSAPPVSVRPAPAPVAVPDPGDSAYVLACDSAPLRVPRARCRLSIGRAAGNTFVLSDDSVSSRHALLEFDGQALQVTDLNSTNGTSINGWHIPPGKPITLQPADQVAIGEQFYTVHCFLPTTPATSVE